MSKPKDVLIVGGATNKALFKCPPEGIEIWCLNAILFDWVPRVDRYFNLHTYDRLRAYGHPVKRDKEFARKNPDVPFYTLDQWPGAKTKHFPHEKMAKAMPRGGYHCGSFDWMVAFAVYLGMKSVILQGVQLGSSQEPLSSRACLEYWCGYAEGRGTEILTAQDCDLFEFRHVVRSNLIYGIDNTPLFEFRDRKEQHEDVPYRL